MKRNLLSQMRKEWRDNIWLVIELSVVCLTIWAITTVLYAEIQGLFAPRGYDPDNVYELTANLVPEKSTDYISDLPAGSNSSDLWELVRRIRSNPNVEAVGLHNWNALPYSFNYQGQNVQEWGVNDSIDYYGNVRVISPDFIKVLGIKSLTGASDDQLVGMLKKGEVLLSNNGDYESQGRDAFALKGKRVIVGGDSSRVMKVGDIVEHMRRNDYEPYFGGTILLPMDEGISWDNIAVRVKPGKGKAFEEDFRNDVNLRKLRNVYLSDLKSLMTIRELNQRETDTKVRLMTVMVGFLLATIFLGLLGTFWFRMQQRVSEIAIRKVAGATRSDLFRRILSEGMILLLISGIVVSVVIWPFILTDSDMVNVGIEKWKLLVFELLSLGVMSIGIVCSLWWPARKAMSVEPAIAIKAE